MKNTEQKLEEAIGRILSELHEANKLEKSYDNLFRIATLAKELKLVATALQSHRPKPFNPNPYEVFVPKGRYTGD